MTDYQLLVETFTKLGIKFEECDERVMTTPIPVLGATKFLSVLVAHYHFAADGTYLGTECNGDGTFVKSTKL